MIADIEKRAGRAANLEFKEAARLRDELRWLEATELMVGTDHMARQAEVERKAGRYAGQRKFGTAANLPPQGTARNRPRKPTDADMGPHNWRRGRQTALCRQGGRSTGQKTATRRYGSRPRGSPGRHRYFPPPRTPRPKVGTWKKGGRGRRGQTQVQPALAKQG